MTLTFLSYLDCLYLSRASCVRVRVLALARVRVRAPFHDDRGTDGDCCGGETYSCRR